MRENTRTAPKPLPTLLTKTDAMIHAAESLERQAVDLELINLLVDSFRKKPDASMADNARDALDELNVVAGGIVDAKLQQEAMRSAAKEIRALAMEAKLADARANRDGIRVGA